MPLDDPKEIRRLLRTIKVRAVRERLVKGLRLWEQGMVRETLTQFRVTAEEALHRLVRLADAPTGARETMDEHLGRGQNAKVIDWLHKKTGTIPARIALHLHTLLAWGNYASHHQKQGHEAGAFDFDVLVSIGLSLEDWIATEKEGAPSIFGPPGTAELEEEAEESLAGTGVGQGIAKVLVQVGGARLVSESCRLWAPEINVEIRWDRPEQTEAVGDPFRGLEPFGPEDADVFHGRNELRAALIRRVEHGRLTVVSGASGAGKTSLLRAGLLPDLLQRKWCSLYIADYSPQVLEVLDKVSDPTVQLDRLLVVLDQLERLLLADTATTVRHELLDRLIPALLLRDDSHLVLGIREDYLGELYRVAEGWGPEAAATLHERRAFVAVNPLTRAESRDAITGPLERTTVRFDEMLVDEMLLPALSEEAGISPVHLQVVCSHLYQAATVAMTSSVDETLYNSLGGAERILKSHVEQTLEGSQYGAQRDLARAALKAMTGANTRRWLDTGRLWETLVAAGHATDEVQLQHLLSQLVKDRLVVSRTGEISPVAEYSLVHDQLVATVREWMTPNELEVREARELLVTAVARWKEHGAGEPLSGRALKLVETHWAGLHEQLEQHGGPEQANAARQVVRASRQRRRRQHLAAGGLAAVTLLALLFGAYQLHRAIVLRQEAEQQRQRAERQRAEAQREGARAAFLRGDLVEARAKLRAALEADDSPLARVLWGQMQRNPMLWRQVLGASALAVAVSPDGQLVAAGCQDGAVYLVQRETQRVTVRRAHADQVMTLAFSPDGRYLASGALNGEIVRWDLKQPDKLKRMTGHTKPVWQLAFGPKGTLASASWDGTVRLWKVQGEPRRFAPPGCSGSKGLDCQFGAVAFDRGGKLLAAGTRGGRICLWNLERGSGPRLVMTTAGKLTGVAFGPDGRWLAAGGSSGASLVPLAGEARSLPGYHGGVWDVDVTSDGSRIAVAGHDGVIRVYTVPDLRLERSFRHDGGAVTGVRFGPDRRWLVSGGLDKTARVWSLRERVDTEGCGPTGKVRAVAVSPGGKLVVSGDADGNLVARSISTGYLVWRRLEGAGVLALDLSPDGSWLAAGTSEGKVLVYEAAGAPGGKEAFADFVGDEVRAIGFNRDGRLLAAGAKNGVFIWSTRAWKMERELGSTQVRSLAFSPNGRRLATGGEDWVVRVWDVASGREVLALRQHRGPVYGVAHVDERTLVSASLDGQVLVWDTLTGTARPLGRLPGRKHAVAVSPDGQWVAVASSDGAAQIHGLGTGVRSLLRGHQGEINSVRFSADGRVLATGSDDGTVRLWDPATWRATWRAPVVLPRPPRLYTHAGWRPFTAGVTVRATGTRWERAIARRARLASERPGGGLLCLMTHDGAVELWEQRRDRRLFRQPVDGLKQIIALSGGCLALGRDEARLFGRDGSFKAFAGAQAIGWDGDEALVATHDTLQVLDATGRTSAEHRVRDGVTAMAHIDGALFLGFRDGTLEVIGPAAQELSSPGLRPSSPVIVLQQGPSATLIAGYADGHLMVWDTRTGVHVATERLYGAVIHLLVNKSQIIAATDLGHQWHIDAFRPSYCELLREVWASVPVTWKSGRVVLEPPRRRHPCYDR